MPSAIMTSTVDCEPRSARNRLHRRLQPLAAATATLAAALALTACGSSGGRAAPKDCSSLTGQKVAADATAQFTAACSGVTVSTGNFPCTVDGRAVGPFFYVKGTHGNFAGRTGGTWVKASAAQAEKLGTLARLAGCDVS